MFNTKFTKSTILIFLNKKNNKINKFYNRTQYDDIQTMFGLRNTPLCAKGALNQADNLAKLWQEFLSLL